MFPHLFFDLDHTLWDYSRNANETLAELVEEHQLLTLGVPSLAAFLHSFHQHNAQVWAAFSAGSIGAGQLRQLRFQLVFAHLGLPQHAALCGRLSDEYMARCPHKPHLLPGALATLQQLAGSHRLHIITNGFAGSQRAKLQAGGIAHFFETVTTNECTGHRKPHPRIFAHALQRAGAQPHTSLMVGDNLETDIGGGRNAGMHTAWLSTAVAAGMPQPTFQIAQLSQLPGLLQQQ